MDLDLLVKGLSSTELKQLGALIHAQSTDRVWSFYEGTRVARDSQQQGQVFSHPYIDHAFSNFVEELGNLLQAQMHGGEAILPERRLLPELTAQLQMERARRIGPERQMT
jgi:hypothetical protein